MKKYWIQIFNLLQKDITTEMRAKESVSAMLVFGLTIIVVFSFAFNLGINDQTEITPGLLWVAFTFSGILGLNHSFLSEHENACLNGILLTPIPRSALYIGKFLSNFVFMLFSEIIILGFFLWLFDVSFMGNYLYLFLVMILGTAGFTATGTIFSAISASTRMKVFLLPLLQFPIVIPLIIISVEATGALLQSELPIGFFDWVSLLTAFDIIFITISIMLFDYILEE